jgi:hypothetical protein
MHVFLIFLGLGLEIFGKCITKNKLFYEWTMRMVITHEFFFVSRPIFFFNFFKRHGWMSSFVMDA